MKKYKIGIIGNGFVGKATSLLECENIEILMYDIKKELCKPKNLELKDLLITDLIFICVPTPMKENGECHIEIIKDVLNKLKNINYKNFIILRSTVPVNTCNNLNTYFMPEFLTERNYINDFINNNNWIFGLLNNNNNNDKNNINFKLLIKDIFLIAKNSNKIKYDNISFVENNEAEMIKLFKNCYLATKVSFCNEIYRYCEKKNINYENVRKIVVQDLRIGESHTLVPGLDNKFGYGGTCFPKDTNNLFYEMKKIGLESYIIKNIIERNNNIDRIEKDWDMNDGRTTLKDI